MSTCSERKPLSLMFREEETLNYSEVNSDGDYYICVGSNTDLREKCRAVAEAFGGIADCIENALWELLDWLNAYETLTIGEVREEGWYTPAHYCYSDPAAAYDSEGGITEAVVDTDTEDQLLETLRTAITEAINGMEADEVVPHVVAETLRICEPTISRWYTEGILEFDGDDIHED